VNDGQIGPKAAARASTVMSMRLARPKPDPHVLDLFQESGRNVQRTAVLLRELMTDYPESNGVGAEIVACEHEGDRIAHDILHRLAQQTSRRAVPEPADVHALAVALDDIVDFAEEAADQLGRYGVEASMLPAQEIADVLVRASDQLASALAGLRDGSDAGAHLVEIHRLENEADRIVREAVASLFVNGIDPMVVIRWKDIFESLEAAVDACETAANVLEGIALKRGR
jgi:uncharacterized protein Yka (UPF0111/DUF47 family)